MGLVYLLPALALNAGFLALAVRAWRSTAPETSWQLFKYSVVYLGLLFAFIALDGLV